ncbi:MAG: DNA repair protein RecO [Flavobacteriaceae bacterium]|nr:DNA repair protein RecO [Flavobacteriaceae bacterium]
MLVLTKAIVLNTIKFQDSSLIVKCYTERGIKAYLLKGILTTKKGKLKPAHFQIFTLLEIVAKHNNKGNLNYIKELQVYHPFHSLHTNIYKSTMAIFLAEILTNVLKEEEENITLFQFLEKAFIWLDSHNEITNFHLLFLLNLTKHLGFYPKNNTENTSFFDLKQGVFTKNKPITNFIFDENLTLLKSIIGINFDTILKMKFNAKKRYLFLTFLIDYFALHLPAFKRPKSLAVLQSVFK